MSSAASGNQQQMELERLVQKERFKEAVKQAKLCYKQENTPENHQLLERMYFLRARQLVQTGMTASAVEVAGHLLEFGVTPSDWIDELIVLLTSLGLNKDALSLQERFGSPDKKEQLVVLAADEAVIHPERQKDASPEITRDADLIRRSLERLSNNDEAGALSLLRDLPRSSVLSEWKFFARGLAAYYRGASDETTANWNRLDTQRKAFPITQRLMRLRETNGSAAIEPASVKTLESQAFGQPVFERLRQLSGVAAQKDWHQVSRLMGPLRIALARIEPGLAEQLTGALIGSVIKEAQHLDLDDAERLVHKFTSVAEPLPFDPRWNRLWAMLWDGPQGDASVALEYWAKYVDDLNRVTVYNDSERALAQALVCNRMAALYRDEVADLTEGPGPFGLPLPVASRKNSNIAAIIRAKKKVIECLEKSLALAPGHLPTYQFLVEIYRGWDETEQLEAAARRLLAQFPEDLETLQLLTDIYIGKNELESALPLAQKARSLKPLDDSLRDLEWTVRVGLARTYALAKKWDSGRNELAIAEQLRPECRTSYSFLARRAIFEAKAGQADRSKEHLTDAEALLKDPTPLWLALMVESIRYRLPKATQQSYAQAWETGLKQKCRSETAGEMASVMYAFLESNIKYTGRAGHVKKVAAYLQRTSQVKYRRADIEHVVEFLDLAQGNARLLEKMVKLGIKQHPDSALLNFRAALQEKGGGFFDFGAAKAERYLEKARKLAEASSNPKDKDLLPAIQKALTLLNMTGFGRMGFPTAGAGSSTNPFPPAFAQFFDFFDDEFDDQDDDVGPNRPHPRRGRKT